MTTPSAPVHRVVEIDGIPMSGLLSEARRPHAVIVALHGGATNSAYFDCPGHPELSLLRTAAAAGYTVLALDRPGYGASSPHAIGLAPPQRRVDLVYAAVDRHLTDLPRGAGVFLWAHSIGCELAVRLAADPQGGCLLGLELAGTGREHHALARPLFSGKDRYAKTAGVGELLWTPAELYPPDVIGGAAIASPTPAYETGVVGHWPTENFPALAARVRIPVHFTSGDHEKVWRGDPAALGDIAAMFTATPRVSTHVQAHSGHNLSLGLSAPAYHSAILSFVEDCIGDALTRPDTAIDDAATARPGR